MSKQYSERDRLHASYAELPYWEALVLRLAAKGCKQTLQSIVPVAAAVFGYLLLATRSFGACEVALLAWSGAEVLFLLACSAVLPTTRAPKSIGTDEMLAVFGRVRECVGDMNQMLGRWLLEQPMELYQEHFSEWMAWLMFGRREEQLTAHEHAQVAKVQSAVGCELKKSPAPLRFKPRCMRPSLDALPRHHKPLAIYAGIKAIHALANLTLRWLGFRRDSTEGLSYWRCPGNSNEPPILFIHGLGVGLFPYLEKIRRLRQRYTDRRILLLELPHVSMCITHHFLSHDQTLHAIDSIFERHALGRVSLVAHSYGTVLASWLVQKRQHLLSNVTLLDPICFNMWESTLAYNFLYAEPFSFVHEMATFFVARDPLICHTITSELHWHESVLFPQDVHVPTHVFLSAQDWVIDAVACAKYLRATLPPCGSVHLLDTSHGGFLALPSLYSRVFDTI